jgi:cytochrome c biogenesis protein CcmG/thiol:disulfide interchange protein DsbE
MPDATFCPLSGMFSLTRLKQPEATLGTADLKGKVSLFNVWATWCVACRSEHPVLMQLAESGRVAIYGLNYKDDRAEAKRWLLRYGDPYIATVRPRPLSSTSRASSGTSTSAL